MQPDLNIYTDKLRGNRDVFLGNILCSNEFNEIKTRYIKNEDSAIFGIYQLLGHTDSTKFGLKIESCVNEVSDKFKIKKDIALKLILNSHHTLALTMNYAPYVYNDGEYAYIRIGPKTTQNDIKNVWKLVKTEQRKLDSIGSKSSINPELAFCIHRQLIINQKKIAEVFEEYLNNKLDRYNHPPTITDVKDFKKYYDKTVRGILIR